MNWRLSYPTINSLNDHNSFRIQKQKCVPNSFKIYAWGMVWVSFRVKGFWVLLDKKWMEWIIEKLNIIIFGSQELTITTILCSRGGCSVGEIRPLIPHCSNPDSQSPSSKWSRPCFLTSSPNQSCKAKCFSIFNFYSLPLSCLIHHKFYS